MGAAGQDVEIAIAIDVDRLDHARQAGEPEHRLRGDLRCSATRRCPTRRGSSTRGPARACRPSRSRRRWRSGCRAGRRHRDRRARPCCSTRPWCQGNSPSHPSTAARRRAPRFPPTPPEQSRSAACADDTTVRASDGSRSPLTTPRTADPGLRRGRIAVRGQLREPGDLPGAGGSTVCPDETPNVPDAGGRHRGRGHGRSVDEPIARRHVRCVPDGDRLGAASRGPAREEDPRDLPLRRHVALGDPVLRSRLRRRRRTRSIRTPSTTRTRRRTTSAVQRCGAADIGHAAPVRAGRQHRDRSSSDRSRPGCSIAPTSPIGCGSSCRSTPSSRTRPRCRMALTGRPVGQPNAAGLGAHVQRALRRRRADAEPRLAVLVRVRDGRHLE